MQISLHQLGKRYNRHWIFRNLTMKFESGSACAITGPNGSGKSTLLQVMAGATEKSEGAIEYSWQGKRLEAEDYYRHVSICAPYLELVEELTLKEFLDFQGKMRSWLPGLNTAQVIAKLGLESSSNKLISQFSSGMKQRVKLAQAIFTNTPVVLLDEPTSNLDLKGIDLYHQLVSQFTNSRLLVVASNDEQEISFCTRRINIMEYKTIPAV